MTYKILAVDDEEKNLKLIQGFLQRDGYEVITASDGMHAWKLLQNLNNEIDVILTDRMMPNMDGMELTKKVKAHPEMRNIPIIMQTAAAQKDQVAEGVKAGVYYYLTKPFDSVVLISIISAAISDAQVQKELILEVHKHKKVMEFIDTCHFSFSRLDDARDLTIYLANFFPDPDRVTLGISEILINAVEHGNLGITYDEKTALNSDGKWGDEVHRREKLPDNSIKKVAVSYVKSEKEISLIVKDQGAGFDWKKYMDIDPERATDNHGRGIAMSNLMSFDKLEYIGNGNEVHCKVLLND